MLILIPIRNDLKIEDLHELNNQKNSVFITSIDVISKMELRDDYPIQKRLAMKKILTFLNYLDLLIDEDGFTINKKILERYLHSKHYKKYLAILKELKVLSDIPHTDNYGNTLRDKDGKAVFYVRGVKSKKYRFYSEYKHAHLCIAVIQQEELKKKKVAVKTDSGNYNKKMIDTIRLSTIDFYNSVFDEIKYHLSNNTTTNSLRVRINKILSLNAGDRSIRKGINVNRVYHTLSSLSRIARPFLTCKKNQFYNIDIKNAQPLLLAWYLRKNNMNVDSNYCNHCESGLLYENFITPKMDRDKVKPEIYRCVYFKFQQQEPINQKFKQLFPLTWASLKKLNKKKGLSIAAELQNAEADIFNNIIVKSRYYYTLHDAIYFSDKNEMQELKDQIEKAFWVYGLKPSF